MRGAASSFGRRPGVWGGWKGRAGRAEGQVRTSAPKQGVLRLDRAVCRRR